LKQNQTDLNDTNLKETFSNNEDLSFDFNGGKDSQKQTQKFDI